MDGTLRLALPARPENVALVRSAVGERAEADGLTAALVADLKTVVSEACANVVVHAYADTSKPGLLEVDMTRGAKGVKVVIRDHGAGIRPQPKATHASLKVGLPLIGAIANSFELRSARNLGTELSVYLALPAGD